MRLSGTKFPYSNIGGKSISSPTNLFNDTHADAWLYTIYFKSLQSFINCEYCKKQDDYNKEERMDMDISLALPP